MASPAPTRILIADDQPDVLEAMDSSSSTRASRSKWSIRPPALGASPAGMIRMVVRQGSWPVVIGLFVGVGLAIGLSRVLASQLVNITATDPLTYILVGFGLLLVVVLACWLPAPPASTR